MCYSLQGPRCSYHAFNEYIDASNRYERCSDPVEKIKLGETLENKRKLFHATPRGQNWLRQEHDRTPDGLEKENLKIQMQAGAKLREAQLETYKTNKERHKTKIKETFNNDENDLKMGKYNSAVAVVYSFLLDRLPEQQMVILDDTSIEITGFGKMLIIPNKYQKNWGAVTMKPNGEYSSEDYKLEKLLNSQDQPSFRERLSKWFTDKLSTAGYKAVAVVNLQTEDVLVMSPDALDQIYLFEYKLAKRLGGTTKYYGDLDIISKLLVGTPFEKATLMSVESAKSTIVLDAPLSLPKDRILSSDFSLGFRGSSSAGDYYEVRRRHNSNNYNFFLKLKIKRALNVSGFDNSIQEQLAKILKLNQEELKD